MSIPGIAFSPHASVSVITVGREASPVLVIDNALADARTTTQYGMNAAFSMPSTAYPGLNAPLPADTLSSLVEALRPPLSRVFDIAADAMLVSTGYFGLVTLRPENLSPGQSIPHIDAVGEGLAMVTYLCGEHQGGTGFYRHRSTGFERLTRDRIATYNAALQFETRRGLPPAYPVGDHPLFELIGNSSPRFNRMVIYPCNLLHSGQVDPEQLSADPKRGRLTLNGFIGLEN